jgi:hypothetical protein
MQTHTRFRLIATSAAIGLTSVAAGVATAADAPDAPTKKITHSGVGKVKLGRSYKYLRHRHLVGKLQHGCELGGPSTRAASLKSPLKGSVNFTLKNPRKVTDITVTAGGAARGVGIGENIKDIKKAFPKAKVDHSTEKQFGYTSVRVPKSGGGRLEFSVSTKSKHVDAIGIPFLAVCE